MNKTVEKDGKTVAVCNYMFVDHEGHVETCRHVAECPICGQCSRIDGERENGHCAGHFGLNQFIWVPGMEKPKTAEAVSKPVRKQPKPFKRPPKSRKNLKKH